jgi:3'-phosphoadenosine 5'-phosphosulfate sulfotransferase (PAPS reductase)/FAD synthetase
MADDQFYPKHKIVVSHQDLGEMEWEGTRELAGKQAADFGLKIYFSKRRDKNGYEETLLEYIERRKKFPSNNQRYCTSDFKRAPGARVVTMLTKGLGECKILHVFGFRKEESPARSKKPVLAINKMLTTKKRLVHDYLPIHDWSTKYVWKIIKHNKLDYHPAYDLGMPRLSCCFCIFSPFDALVTAGKANPELLNRYVEIENKIGHTFKAKSSIGDVKKAINDGYEPKQIMNWIM